MSVPLSSATSAPMARKGSGAPDAPSGAGGASTGSSSATNVRVPIMHDYEGARERSRVLRTLSHLSKTQASSSSLDGAYAYPETESDSETPQRSSSASSPPTRPAARSPAASLRGSFSAFARGAAAAVRATGAASGAGGGAVYYVTEQPGGPASAGIGGRSSRQGSASDTPAMPIPTTPGAGPTRRPRRESPGMNASAAFASESPVSTRLRYGSPVRKECCCESCGQRCRWRWADDGPRVPAASLDICTESAARRSLDAGVQAGVGVKSAAHCAPPTLCFAMRVRHFAPRSAEPAYATCQRQARSTDLSLLGPARSRRARAVQAASCWPAELRPLLDAVPCAARHMGAALCMGASIVVIG
ncbi:hypothetical protein FA09DRAFT_63878 [Tilletiopsis washingtonensis]|uniref:Uncharacterized protein n=1 Tax=Tilletiopsis washingtonensis TaxID=58919 RepID=A0A316Z6I6_9BASI|nr:hypothetical protein FA09DRAFT_63878 [Tilletiopsis washingtonensis]PWN97181.1 hypothetical protein FA09DRAFT_63878 [Tilletiopsis washingtonensis]